MKKEFFRKSIHLIVGLILLTLLYLEYLSIWVLLGFLLITAITMMLAISNLSKTVRKLISKVERPGRLPGLSGVIYMIGILVVFLLFSEEKVFAAALIVFILGDGLSGLIDSYNSWIKLPYNPKKSLAGLLMGILASTAGVMLIFPWYVAFAGSVFTLLIETLPLRIKNWEIDDNLFVPVIAGAFFYACLGWV